MICMWTELFGLSTAHNRDLGRTALLRLALDPSKWFRKQCGGSGALDLSLKPYHEDEL